MRERWLVFSPPRWYDALVFLCLLVGLRWLIYGALEGSLFFAPLGLAVLFAGIWAALSNERMVCDLRNKTYTRLEGPGFGKRVIRGQLSELDAVVLRAEHSLRTSLSHNDRWVVYRLALHWKGNRHPLLIVEREDKMVSLQKALNYGAGRLFEKGQRYAHALAVPMYDNSHFHSPAPVPFR